MREISTGRPEPCPGGGVGVGVGGGVAVVVVLVVWLPKRLTTNAPNAKSKNVSILFAA
jgi:hypothetical protein